MEEYYCAEQQLCRIRQNVASSSSAAAMAGALEGVAQVYEHVGSLVRFACAEQVEEELEESVALLDACAAARDSLRAMRACALDLEMAVRRGDGAGAQSAATAYARLARKARADIKKQQRRLTRRERRAAGDDVDEHSLQEARRAAVDVLERVVTALSRSVLAASATGRSRWSTCLVRAFRNRTRVACEDAEEITAASSPAFTQLCSSSPKDMHDGETAWRVQKQLRTLGDTIQRLEDGLELLFRRLVQCRVFLLNMCSSLIPSQERKAAQNYHVTYAAEC
ncbi:hypothetical protein E2562_007193 [Oryza meyeriana var. granulata]|uniref:Uncharacterized protein n=1 Tax=Oryza meyeriana var. granulata TaxID=110450 RepID=A0A6G1CFF5_9ORYZ|nr:hypothetical protein E2562_007193 [Oryza meyeriana var. granulata]